MADQPERGARFGIDYGKGESPAMCKGDRNVEFPQRDACQEKARATGEQTFTLRAQDHSSPFIIAEWIKENILTCPSHKLYEALGIAIKMREHRGRKTAD